MGAKAKKTLKKNSSQLSISRRANESSDFLTGKSKHYGFLEFENPEVAKVVADEMNNYLLFEHNLQLSLIPQERVHPKLWKGLNQRFKPLDWKAIAQKRHKKERTMEEHQHMVQEILKRGEKRHKRIKAAGIDYECPDFVGVVQPAPKKIKFTNGRGGAGFVIRSPDSRFIAADGVRLLETLVPEGGI